MNRKIYIDVTNVVSVKFLTGIQRVVRNIVINMLKAIPERVILLRYNSIESKYYIIDNTSFAKKYMNNMDFELEEIEGIGIDDITSNDIFFDMDSVWNSKLRRNVLYSKLKNNGVIVVTYIYDIIPIMYPQFCHMNTVVHFMEYISAVIKYSDYIITSTQYILDKVNELAADINMPQKQGGVSWLGSDFVNDNYEEKVDFNVIEKLKNKKFTVCVGTIEPRKNHKFLIKAFENNLFKEDICLVFAGRFGWNVDDVKEMIENSPYNNKQLFHFEGLNDASIAYLYENAIAMTYATYDEGFGLPIIESYQHRTPVIATDCQVLREVGGDYADYFELNNENEFVELVNKYVNDKEYVNRKRKSLDSYKFFSWEDASNKIIKLLDDIPNKSFEIKDSVKQIFILTARSEAIINSLTYIEKYMPFIKEAVLCCPDNIKDELVKNYSGRLDIKVVTDSEALSGNELPEDHQLRNTFLRACIFKKENLLDDAFIMSDDDYRPLKEIAMDFFICNGKYNAYYFYNLSDWRGTYGNLSSYDKGMLNTYEYLKSHNYPTRQYSAHMPQIIDKRIYLELLEKHSDINSIAIDEWSIYFNYLQKEYPNIINNKKYASICWPGATTDWEMKYFPDEYLFENYYENLYENGQIFEGLSRTYNDKTDKENEIKISLVDSQLSKEKICQTCKLVYEQKYQKKYGEVPSYTAIIGDNNSIILPDYICGIVGKMSRFPLSICTDLTGKIDITFHIKNNNDEDVVRWKETFSMNDDVEIHMYYPRVPGVFLLVAELEYGGKKIIGESMIEGIEIEVQEMNNIYSKLYDIVSENMDRLDTNISKKVFIFQSNINPNVADVDKLIEKRVSNIDFLHMAYLTFFNRIADPTAVKIWNNFSKLNMNTYKRMIVNSLMDSEECKKVGKKIIYDKRPNKVIFYHLTSYYFSIFIYIV